MSLTSSPKLIKGGLVVLGARRRRGTTHASRCSTTPTRSRAATRCRASAATAAASARSRSASRARPSSRSSSTPRSTPPTSSNFPDRTPTRWQFGIAPQLAALEALVNPSDRRAAGAGDADAPAGTLEILPPEAPLVLFIWSRSRVVPVRVTEFSVTEEAFDPALNPIRAKVSLGLRVMTTDDLGFAHRGGTHLPQLSAHARGAGAQEPARDAGSRSASANLP